MAKSLSDYKDELDKQRWEEPPEPHTATPDLKAPYFKLPPVGGHGVVIPVEAFENKNFATTLQNATVILVLVAAVCTLIALNSTWEIWVVADRMLAGRVTDSARDVTHILTHSAFVCITVFGVWFMWRVAPKKLDLTFSQDGVTYVFWTRKGDVIRETSYTSYQGIRHTHTIMRGRDGQIHNHKIALVHPDPLLTLTLHTQSGEFDDRLCNRYADATGLPILEPHKSTTLWPFPRNFN